MVGTRRLTAAALLIFILAVLALDMATSAPLDPFGAPPILALGSGQASGAAHCASLPGD